MAPPALLDRLRAAGAFEAAPPAFSVRTAEAVWLDPHIQRSLILHQLDPSSEIGSRSSEHRTRAARWLRRRLPGPCPRALDLGCGIGLWSSALAQHGCRVLGVDVSSTALDHARRRAGVLGERIEYRELDYGALAVEGGFDLALLPFWELSTLSPTARSDLLRRLLAHLAPGGWIAVDALSLPGLNTRPPGTRVETRPTGGFWSPEPHHVFEVTFRLGSRLLQRVHILPREGPDRCLFNWMQAFDPEALRSALERAGFQAIELLSSLTGDPWTPSSPEIAAVARRPG